MPVGSAPAGGDRARRVRAGAGVVARDVTALVAIALVVALMALGFVWPWLAGRPIGGDWLDRYAPIRDGDARLAIRRDGSGAVTGWQALNSRVIPGLRLFTDIRKAPSDAIIAASQREASAATTDDLQERLRDLVTVETRFYDLVLADNGAVRESWQYATRDERGERLVGLYYPKEDNDIIFDPPALMLPATGEVGDTWSTSGKVGAVGSYVLDGRLAEIGPRAGASGAFDDCLQVSTRLVIETPTSRNESLADDWYCAGIGWIGGASSDPVAGTSQQTTWISAHGSPATGASLPPPPVLLADPPVPSDPDAWRLSRLGRARATGDTSESTIQPLWLPTDPPVVLAAGFEGDLVAFDADMPGATPRWRFHPDGTIYGQPAFDPATGRVYFGASDKHVYALDARGLFLWSFETHDNVAARPLVIGDLVVAASEDGTVYGLDAASGRERWAYDAGGSVVSWPAALGDLVVFGSDAQEVVAVEAATGEPRWTYAAAGAVEAPIAVDPDGVTVYVASRDGTLAAVDTAACAGTCEARWSVEVGSELRTAPTILDDRLALVNGDGELIVLASDDGRRIWSFGGGSFVGAPVRLDDSLLVASSRGTVSRITLDGRPAGRWDARETRNASEDAPSFRLGATLGGDSLWVADTDAIVLRLGPPTAETIPGMRVSWFNTTSRPPFEGNQVRNTVAEYQGRAIVVDFTGAIFQLDAATGRGAKLPTPPSDSPQSQVEPIVAGSTLLTVRGNRLLATDLTNGSVRWQADGAGYTVLPPAVHGDTVLWVTGEGDGSALGAYDLASGARRWHTTVSRPDATGGASGAAIGGVIAAGDIAFTSIPPAAWDIRSGQERWRASIPGSAVGTPGLSPDGGTVYLSGFDQERAVGYVVALDAASGAVRWQADIGDVVMSPLDRVWVADGAVVVPLLGGRIVALGAERGEVRWEHRPPVGRLGNVTVAQGHVWFILENARFFGLDLATGAPRARFVELDLNLNGQGLTQRPTIIGNHAIVPIGLVVLALELPEDVR